MKTAVVLALGAVAMAQSLPSDINSCGRGCISRMMVSAVGFGCTSGNATCYCNEPRFGYGLRDCGFEGCDASQATNIISYGVSYCASALGSSTTGAAVVAITGGSTTTGSSSSDRSATAAGSASSTPITTSDFTTTLSSGRVTSTGRTTIFSPVPTGAEASASSAASSLSSVASSESSVASSAASAASSAASSASSVALAPVVTAAPILGAGAIAAALLVL